MSRKNSSAEEFRKELRVALEKMRREVQNLRRDVTGTTKMWARSSGKAVQDVTPKVSATIDEAVKQTSDAFRRTMTVAEKESRQFQISFLRNYKMVLAKQMDLVEKRLKDLSK